MTLVVDDENLAWHASIVASFQLFANRRRCPFHSRFDRIRVWTARSIAVVVLVHVLAPVRTLAQDRLSPHGVVVARGVDHDEIALARVF